MMNFREADYKKDGKIDTVEANIIFPDLRNLLLNDNSVNCFYRLTPHDSSLVSIFRSFYLEC